VGAERADADIHARGSTAGQVGTAGHRSVVLVVVREQLHLAARHDDAWRCGERRGVHANIAHRQAGRILVAALRRLECRAGDLYAAPPPVHTHPVERTLVDGPLEFAHEPRVDALALHGLDRRHARRSLGPARVRHASHLQVDASGKLSHGEVRGLQEHLVARAAAAVVEVVGAGPERPRPDGVRWQSTELHVLQAHRRIDTPPPQADTGLQAVADMSGRGVAWGERRGLGRRLEELPHLEAGPVPDVRLQQWGRRGCRLREERLRLDGSERGEHQGPDNDGSTHDSASAGVAVWPVHAGPPPHLSVKCRVA